jgi:hypothetical protein
MLDFCNSLFCVKLLLEVFKLKEKKSFKAKNEKRQKQDKR